MSDLAGIWVAVVTPFFTPQLGHQVDHPSLKKLVEHLHAEGVTGLVVLGSTGEASALDDAEQDAVLDTVLSAANGLPVIAGLAGNHVGHLHKRLNHFNTLPLHAVLSPAPYYVRPSQAGLLAHFSALAEASRAPLVLYDIPYRTGVPLERDTVLALADHSNIVGIKDCGGSSEKSREIIADGRLQVLAGEDTQIFHHLCLGAAGAITAAAQVAPHAYMAMYKSLQSGHLEEGRRWHHRLAPLAQALFAEPNPSVVKAALARQGWCSEHVRPPLVPASAQANQQLEATPVPA